MKLMVYNSESDSCREVTVTPNAAWGGEGRYFPRSEGCRVGPWWGLGWAWSSRAPLGGGGLGPGPRDPEADHWPRRHPSRPLTAVSGWDGRDRKGCGTTPRLNVSGLWQSGLWYRLRVSAPDPNPVPQPPQEATWFPAVWYPATWYSTTWCPPTWVPATWCLTTWIHPPGLACPSWPTDGFQAG